MILIPAAYQLRAHLTAAARPSPHLESYQHSALTFTLVQSLFPSTAPLVTDVDFPLPSVNAASYVFLHLESIPCLSKKKEKKK